MLVMLCRRLRMLYKFRFVRGLFICWVRKFRVEETNRPAPLRQLGGSIVAISEFIELCKK
jgi:hypothetical protein